MPGDKPPLTSGGARSEADGQRGGDPFDTTRDPFFIAVERIVFMLIGALFLHALEARFWTVAGVVAAFAVLFVRDAMRKATAAAPTEEEEQ